MKRCCVVGGAGFIGSHLSEMLRLQGREVIIIDRQPLCEISLSKSIRYIPGDCCDNDFLLKALKGVDEIVDLAYATVPKTSYDNPIDDILKNLPIAVRLFEVACKLPIKKIVVVSSGGTVYGRAKNIPIIESHPTNPISPYGITKLAIEKYAAMYHQLKNMPVVCVRPSNAYGERQRPFSGQGFVSTAIANIMNQEAVVLFGETGTIRDYIYVGDVAIGIIAALDNGKPGHHYNIGTGIGKNNREILNVIEPLAATLGFETEVRIVQERGFDVPVNVLDSTKLNIETGWKPLMSLERGIQRTWDWFCSQYRDRLSKRLKVSSSQ